MLEHTLTCQNIFWSTNVNSAYTSEIKKLRLQLIPQKLGNDPKNWEGELKIGKWSQNLGIPQNLGGECEHQSPTTLPFRV